MTIMISARAFLNGLFRLIKGDITRAMKRNTENSPLRLLVLPFLLGTAPVICFIAMPPPFAFALAFFFLCALCIWVLRTVKTPSIKNAALCFLTLSLSFFIAEAWLGTKAWNKDNARKEAKLQEQSGPRVVSTRVAPDGESFTASKDYFFNADPKLGYGPKPMAVRLHAVKECGETFAYDVVYSTLPSGWRVTPQQAHAKTAVVVFGCSFAWGEGLEDNETFPWLLGERLGPDYQVFNFGIQGYGSHHMLAWIEHGILRDISQNYDKVLVFYSTIRGHELRSMGYSLWDAYGPWYDFEKGKIVRKGIFADKRSSLRPYTDAVLGKSQIYRTFLTTKFYPRWMRFKHHAGIIAEASRIVQEKYAGTFTAVLWPGVLFKEALDEEGLAVIDLTDSFPNWNEDHDAYRIPCDSHPNARAAHIVADVLYKFIHTRQQ